MTNMAAKTEIRRRCYVLPDNMDLADALLLVRDQTRESQSCSAVRISRGAFFTWDSPETEEERKERLEWVREHDERKEAWERKTLSELIVKYGLPDERPCG